MNMWRSKQNQAGSFLFACSVGVVRGLRRLCLCCLLVYTSAYIWVNEFVCPRCVTCVCSRTLYGFVWVK